MGMSIFEYAGSYGEPTADNDDVVRQHAVGEVRLGLGTALEPQIAADGHAAELRRLGGEIQDIRLQASAAWRANHAPQREGKGPPRHPDHVVRVVRALQDG